MTVRRRTGGVVGVAALVSAVVVGIAVPLGSTAAGAAECPVFNGTAIGSPYTVPATGVSELGVTVNGQPGQGWYTVTSYGVTIDIKGGMGSQIYTLLAVTPGQIVQGWRLAGAAGGYGGAWAANDAGQLPAPGPPGGNGGDAQYVTVTGSGSGACAQIVVLAAGGGGAGAGTNYFEINPSRPGGGGNADAGSGATGGGNGDANDSIDGGGGGPASATAGGFGGAAGHTFQTCRDGNPGQAGGFQSGGGGGLGHAQGENVHCKPGFGGGGGGAGYYFGGGGGTGWDNEPSGGGGGGSSYVMPGITVLRGPVPIETSVGDPSIVPLIDTAVTLSSSVNPSTLGQPVTFTAVVSALAPSAQIGGGRVSFRNGNALLDDVPVVVGAGGTATATFATSSLPGGTHQMSATYGGFSGDGLVNRPTIATKLEQGVGPKITFTSGPPAGAQANGPTYLVTATNSAGLDINFSIDPSSSTVCTISGATVSFIGGGTCRIHADQYTTPTMPFEAHAQQDVTVAAATVQTITFTSTPPVGAMPGDNYVVSATGGASGNAVTFSTGPTDPCQYTGTATNIVQLQAGGVCRIFAHQNGGNGFAAADAQQDVNIGAVPDRIIFDSTLPAEAVPGDTYLLVAHTAGFNQVVFSLAADSAGCTKAADGQYGQYQASAQITFTGVGTCKMVATTVGNLPRISGAQAQQTMVVKLPQAITLTTPADAPRAMYGGTLVMITTGGGSGNPVTATTLTPAVCTVSNGTISFLAAAFCQVRYNQAGNATYASAPFKLANIFVDFAPLTITPPNVTLGYGASVPASFTPVITGLVAGDTEASFTTPVTCAPIGTVAGIGSYAIRCQYGPPPGYRVTASQSTLTITQAELTVAAPAASFAYGVTVPASFTPVYSGFAPGESVSSLTTPATCAPTSPVEGVGTYTIACSGAAGPNYAFTYTSSALAITQAELTVAAPAASFAYGATVPASFTPGYSGFVAGESVSSLTTPATCAPTTAVTGVGNYAIACSGAVGPNYTFTYTSSTLAITPAGLTVSAPSESFVYGATVPASFTPAAYAGFVAGDSVSSLTTPASCSATVQVTGVGAYVIACSGVATPNYSITYVDGSLAITAAGVTVTAPARSVTYGAPASSVSLTPSVDGLVNGDTQSLAGLGPVSCATTAVVTAGGRYQAGSFPITCTGPASTANYAVTYVSATLTVSRAPLTITASSGTSTYGQAPATVTASYSGFTNADTAGALSTPPSCGTTAAASSPVGTYPTSCAGAAGANYEISYVDGADTVTPATLTVTPANQSKTYGGGDPAFAFSIPGFVNGDPDSVVGTQPVCTVVPLHVNAGSYPISCTGGSAANYLFDVTGTATLTVDRADLTITADDKSKVYGQPNPPFTATPAGLVNGDTLPSLGSVSLDTAATATSAVGSYAVTPSGLTSPNYTVTFVPGTLSVTQAESSTALSASPRPSVFGQPVTMVASLTLAPAGAGTATGSVTFKNGTATLGESTVTGGTATLTVTTLSVGSHTLTAVYAGDVNVNASTSIGLVQTVSAAPTNLVAAPAARQQGRVTFSATLTRAFDAAPLAGRMVTFTSNKKSCSATTNAAGVASCAITGLPSVGTFVAGHAGDTNYLASTATRSL